MYEEEERLADEDDELEDIIEEAHEEESEDSGHEGTGAPGR